MKFDEYSSEAYELKGWKKVEYAKRTKGVSFLQVLINPPIEYYDVEFEIRRVKRPHNQTPAFEIYVIVAKDTAPQNHFEEESYPYPLVLGKFGVLNGDATSMVDEGDEEDISSESCLIFLNRKNIAGPIAVGNSNFGRNYKS